MIVCFCDNLMCRLVIIILALKVFGRLIIVVIVNMFANISISVVGHRLVVASDHCAPLTSVAKLTLC